MNGIQEKEAEEWLSNFPRLFDLYQQSNKADPKNYFNFKELFPWASAAFSDIEKKLAELDTESWKKLLEKALPYVVVDDPLRGYQQLFSALDEARGYIFLVGQGYERIEFIKPNSVKQGIGQSPDLLATKVGSTAILEVKTINESDANLAPNASWRNEAVMVRPNLSEEFKRKVVSTIEQARKQLNSYPPPSERKIVFLVVRFDFGLKTGGHLYVELENFIASQPLIDGIEVYHQATL
ncbi:MAG: hypothetical protein WBN22_01565 [Verrucomicrobiia bacterium]